MVNKVLGVPALNYYYKFLLARVIVTYQLPHLWCCQKGRTGIKSVIALYNVSLQKYCQTIGGTKDWNLCEFRFPKARFIWTVFLYLCNGTCNIMGLLCSCINVFFIVSPPLLLPLFPCFSCKNSSFVHFSVCWFAILGTIYNGFYLVDA